MHIRLWTLVPAALLVLGGSSYLASVSTDDRLAANADLFDQISRAAQSYRTRQVLQQRGDRAKASLEELRKQSAALQSEKHDLRLHIAQLQEAWVAVQDGTGIGEAQVKRSTAVLRSQQRIVLTLARERYLAELQTPLLFGAHDAYADLWSAHAAGMTDAVAVARTLLPQLLAAQARLDTLQSQSLALDEQIKTTEEIAARAENELTSVKAITRDVHEQVLLLQGNLARIDAQLRSRAERALIEKGLLSARHDSEHASAVTVQWPVQGSVSAGFRNAAYQAHFGVPHLGADIVVPQGTPVHSAEAGIVFLVRDGGATGYTYILIGHKDGLATLYGHLSQTSVSAGQRVEAGQEIGRSGGTPGTQGAGPMTTAAHLHFEVIRDGVNIDPLSVLP